MVEVMVVVEVLISGDLGLAQALCRVPAPHPSSARRPISAKALSMTRTEQTGRTFLDVWNEKIYPHHP